MRGGTAPCVLIVDDSLDALQTLSDILGVAGYTVRTAPSAERALQILESAAVDVVITDLRMGGMGGMALIRQLRGSHPQLPVIALSGFADAATVAQAFREGAVDFLAKPFTAGEVLEAVARALARRGIPSPEEPEAVPSASSPSALTPHQRARVEEILRGLQGRLGAELVLLIGADGALLAAQGFLAEPAARAVAQGVGRIGAQLEQVASALGESPFTTYAWEGERRALYAVRLMGGQFLVVWVPRTVKPGLVWLELREALSRLPELRSESLIPPSAPAPSPAEVSSEPPFATSEWEAEPSFQETGDLLSYEEARALGLIPDLEEGRGDEG